MKNSKKDVYDLNSSSPSKEPGFDSFETNKHYYFHFNDAKGDCLLFSQSYKQDKSAQNGIASVKKNLKKPGHIILHHDDDFHYFTIKAGNNQEIARSRNFATMEEMDKGLAFLYKYHDCPYDSIIAEPATSRNAISIVKEEKDSLELQLQDKIHIETNLRERLWEVETALAETTSALNDGLLKQENWEKEKNSLEEKLVLLTKKLTDLDVNQTEKIKEEDEFAEFRGTNYGFNLRIYNVDSAKELKTAISSIMSKEQKVFNGFDQKILFDYMISKLPNTVLPAIEEMEEEKALEVFFSNTKITKATDRGIVKRTEANTTPESEIPTPTETVEKTNISTVETTIPVATPSSQIVEKIKEKGAIENIEIALSTDEMEISTQKVPTVATKKVRTIYQMKQFVEEIKRETIPPKKVAIPTPKAIITPTASAEEIQHTQEELAIIEKFFGQEMQTTPIEVGTESVEVIIEQKEITEASIQETEDKTVREFFFQPSENKTALKNIKSKDMNYPNCPACGDMSEEEMATVQHFFPISSSANEENAAPKLTATQNVSTATSEGKEEVSEEELTTIKKFFPPKTETAKTAKVQQRSIEVVEETTVDSKENIAKIQQFFPPKVTETKADKMPEPIIETVQEKEDNQEEMAIIQQFFPATSKETPEENYIVVSDADTDLQEEIATIQQFFPPKTVDAKTEKAVPQNIVVVEETGTNREEETTIIQQFFPPKSIKVEKSKVKDEFIFTVPKEESTNREEELANINQFFGTSKKPSAQKSVESMHEDIIDNLLSNIAVESEEQPEDIENIKKFFGQEMKKETSRKAAVKKKAQEFPEQFQLTVNNQPSVANEKAIIEQFFSPKKAEKKASSKSVKKSAQKATASTKVVESKNDDIALFNKWFGKNVKSQPSSCKNC